MMAPYVRNSVWEDNLTSGRVLYDKHLLLLALYARGNGC